MNSIHSQAEGTTCNGRGERQEVKRGALIQVYIYIYVCMGSGIMMQDLDWILAAIRSPVILFAFEVVFLKVRRAFSFLQMLSTCV